MTKYSLTGLGSIEIGGDFPRSYTNYITSNSPSNTVLYFVTRSEYMDLYSISINTTNCRYDGVNRSDGFFNSYLSISYLDYENNTYVPYSTSNGQKILPGTTIRLSFAGTPLSANFTFTVKIMSIKFTNSL